MIKLEIEILDESKEIIKPKKPKKKLGWIYYVLIGIAVLLIGYSVYAFVLKKDKTDENNNNEVEEEETVDENDSEISIIDLDSNSRSYAVMINNLDAARKYQSGLQDAYIVYEIIVESGITRFMAIFKDQDTARIGSVRSSRDYYLDYVLENDAIYVHYGWSPQAQSDITTLKINNINGLYDSAFWREDLPIAYEHTAFTSMAKIESMAAKKEYRTTTTKDTLLNYSVEEIDLSQDENSEVANIVSIKYSNVITSTYAYNTEDNLYYRSVNGKKHVDYETKKQYTTKNIIIVYADNDDLAGDTKDRQTLDNIGTGNGYYITDGYAIPITWSKSSRSAQTVYKKSNGEEIDVNDGNTYIQIAPLKSATISE